MSVELSTGGSRWGSVAGVKPLLVRDGKLLAQQAAPRDGGALGLVALDTDSGEVATEVAAIPLPDGVTASVGGDFTAWAADVDGEVRVRWRAGDPAAAVQTGAARIDLGSGAASEVSGAGFEREPPPRAPVPGASSYEVASADGRHLMRVEKLPGDAPLYAWSISSLDTGEQVAQLTAAEPAFAFYVHGPIVIAPSPTHVRALALDGGEEVWRWTMLRAER